MHKDYPLTKQQLGLWIETRLHPNNTSYNTCVKVKLTGELNVGRFLNATTNVIRFFDTLKVFFVEKNGIPYQRINHELDYLPEFIDISDGAIIETAAKEQQATQLLSDKLNTAIDLTQFPIMRASLIKTANNCFYFIGMVPHIVSDGRAAILYLESLSIAYNQGNDGLIKTYGDTKKDWENYIDDGLYVDNEDAIECDKIHWEKRLKDAQHHFDYSYGKQLVDANDKTGERVYFDLSEDIAQKLKEHSKANRTTLFNVFVCAFSIFIHKYYGLTDLLIGYPVNIRPPGYKHFFGFFVNILPIRVKMQNNPSYQELLKSVHQTRKEDKKHQKYPALDIVSDIRAQQPDFDGRVFNLSMAQTVSRLFNLELNGVKSEPLDSDYYDVNDDFSLSYEMIENRIGLWFEYRKALFDKPFINQAMKHIETIIFQLLEEPDKKIAEFKLLSNEQEKQLISLASNNTLSKQQVSSLSPNKLDSGSEKNVVALFEQQVVKSKAAMALVHNAQSTSYTELNKKANQLAHHIISKLNTSNTNPKDTPIIAISIDRGTHLIVSLLACLKAGCAYLPLPNSYPRERKHHILRESSAAVWIMNENNSENEIVVNDETLSLSSTAIIALMNDKFKIEQQPVTNLKTKIAANSLSYLIYTSGSSGKPKGVSVEHQQLTSRLLFLADYFRLNKQHKMLQNTDFSFDVSIAEIFWPLISGASLVLTDQQQSKCPNYLLDLIQNERVTVACMVPSLIRVLVTSNVRNQLASLKYLLSAGEALHSSVRDLFYQSNCSTDAELYNFYGPTEATIYTSFEKVSREINSLVTIGRPLADTELFVLDESHNLLPIGVVGELYIGGCGLARGYYNNDSLTARVFPSVEVSSNKTLRLYATGDLVKLNEDGRFEYIARKDKQIKIRGFRIELAEIESIISLCDDIQDCAVIYSGNNGDSGQLIAYLKSHDSVVNKEQLFDQVKSQISQYLPSYMFPSIYSLISELPYLPSGKLNQTLLEKQYSVMLNGDNFELATSDNEIQLVKLWSKILSIPESEISINSSFFDMGGDSLMAIQFVSLAESIGLFFDMGDLFEFRNIKQLAQAVKSSSKISVSEDVVEGCYPLLPRQAKFFHDNFINSNHWNRTFSFTLKKTLNKNAFEDSVKLLLNQHDNLRVTFTRNREGVWQQCCVDYPLVIKELANIISYHDLSSMDFPYQEKQMEQQINLSHQSMSIDNAPLIRIVHFNLSKGKGRMVIIFHHLLIDMVSSRLIFEDLSYNYQAIKNNLPPLKLKKTTSIKQWSNYLNARIETLRFKHELEYWGEREVKVIADLPFSVNDVNQEDTNLIEQINNESSAVIKMFTLKSYYTDKLLKDLPKQKSMPIQDFLLAILLEVVCDWTRLRDIVVSTCGHGRAIDSNEFDLSKTVGWVNTVYPVYLSYPRLNADKHLSTHDLIESVKSQLRCVPKDNINYNLLRYSAKHPQITKHPSPKLFFNYVGQIDSIIPEDAPFVPSLDLPGVAGIDGNNHLCYQLYFEAGIVAGQLMVRLTYSKNLFSSDSIQNLTNNFIERAGARLDDLYD